MSDTTDVEISVTDINDNAPQFFNASYYGSVSEDALTGTSVLQVYWLSFYLLVFNL